MSQQLECPPDGDLRATAGFLAPYRKGVIVSFVLAAAAMVMTVAIPYLTGRAIDQIRAGDRPQLPASRSRSAAAGVLRLASPSPAGWSPAASRSGSSTTCATASTRTCSRSSSASSTASRPGSSCRARPSTCSPCASSSATGSSSCSRARSRSCWRPPRCCCRTRGSARWRSPPSRSWSSIAARYGRRSRPAIQEVQQRIAELTADAEENISGVRVVKAFAREERQLERFTHQVGRVFDQAMVSTRLQAFYNPFIGFLPQLGLAAILLFGGRQVINGSLTLGSSPRSTPTC